MFEPVPEALRDAAEQVRQHLVSLRGGAPFLSPRDAALLLEWLDNGTSVASILTALERAARRRRATRSRVPFSLAHARPHLGKVERGVFTARRAAEDDSHALQPLAAALQARAAATQRPAELQLLAAELLLLDEPAGDALVTAALAASRRYLNSAWDALPAADRDERCDAARDALRGAVTDHEATLEQLCEERARANFRAEYPELAATSLWDLVRR